MANNQIQQITTVGYITATSNKVSKDFKQENPTKTIYIEASDPAEEEKLVNFGLTKYTSKEDGKSFFIIKAPVKGIDVWIKGEKHQSLSSSVEEPNFKTVDGLPIGLAITKGQNKGNDFYRLSAVNLGRMDDIELIEAQNPFA